RVQSREESVDGDWHIGTDTPELPHPCVPQDGSSGDVIFVDTQLCCILGDPQLPLSLADGLLGPLALGNVVNRPNQMVTSSFFVKSRYNAYFAGQAAGRVIRRFFP